jgi:hypothetical protein
VVWRTLVTLSAVSLLLKQDEVEGCSACMTRFDFILVESNGIALSVTMVFYCSILIGTYGSKNVIFAASTASLYFGQSRSKNKLIASASFFRLTTAC